MVTREVMTQMLLFCESHFPHLSLSLSHYLILYLSHSLFPLSHASLSLPSPLSLSLLLLRNIFLHLSNVQSEIMFEAFSLLSLQQPKQQLPRDVHLLWRARINRP